MAKVIYQGEEYFVIDHAEFGTRFQIKIAKSPNANPVVEGKWVDSCDCEEVTNIPVHPSQTLSCFV